MKYLFLILFLIVSCNNTPNEKDILLPEIKGRIACDKFLSKFTQKIKEKMQCENYVLKDLDDLMPTNCTDKLDRLDRICRYLVNELKINVIKWNCKKTKPLSEEDKEELCKEFIKIGD